MLTALIRRHLRQDECMITYDRLIEIIKCAIPTIPLNLGLNCWNSVLGLVISVDSVDTSTPKAG